MDSPSSRDGRDPTVLDEFMIDMTKMVLGGFALATANSWMDVVRFIVKDIHGFPSLNGGLGLVVVSVIITLVTILMYRTANRFGKVSYVKLDPQLHFGVK